MNPQPAILGRQFRVIGAPGSPGFGEDQDPLLVIHEGLRLAEIGRAGTVFDAQPVAFADDAPDRPVTSATILGCRTFGRSGRARRVPAAEPPRFDQPVTTGQRRPGRGTGCPSRTTRPGVEIALAIGERFVELDREGMGEIVQHIFARRDVDLDVIPVLGRDVRQPPLINASPVETIWMTAALPTSRSRSTAAIRDGVFIAVIRWVEEALFRRFEGGARRRFGLAIHRPGFRR